MYLTTHNKYGIDNKVTKIEDNIEICEELSYCEFIDYHGIKNVYKVDEGIIKKKLDENDIINIINKEFKYYILCKKHFKEYIKRKENINIFNNIELNPSDEHNNYYNSGNNVFIDIKTDKTFHNIFNSGNECYIYNKKNSYITIYNSGQKNFIENNMCNCKINFNSYKSKIYNIGSYSIINCFHLNCAIINYSKKCIINVYNKNCIVLNYGIDTLINVYDNYNLIYNETPKNTILYEKNNYILE